MSYQNIRAQLDNVAENIQTVVDNSNKNHDAWWHHHHAIVRILDAVGELTNMVEEMDREQASVRMSKNELQ